MRFFKKLRKFGAKRNKRTLRRHQCGQLQFESMEGRELMAGSVIGGAVVDVAAAATAQYELKGELAETAKVPTGVLQTAENVLSPENVANVVQEQLVATAKTWFQEGTYFKLLGEGKTPQQIVGEFVKDTAKGSVLELARQGVAEASSLNLDQVDAIIEAAQNAIGILSGDPGAVVYAAKLGYELAQDTAETFGWLTEIGMNDPTKPFRDPIGDFEKNLREQFEENDTTRDIADHLEMEGLGGTPDPFNFGTAPSQGGNIGTGPADLGGMGSGPPSPDTSGGVPPSTPSAPPQGPVESPPAVETPNHGGMIPPIGEDHFEDHDEMEKPDTDGENLGEPEPEGEPPAGEEPDGGEPETGVPEGGDESSPSEGDGDPDAFKYHQQNEDRSWSPVEDTESDNDPSGGNPYWWNQRYDDEIMPEEQDETQGTNSSGNDSGNDNTNDDSNDDDDSTDDGAADGAGDTVDEDEGCEAPPGLFDEPIEVSTEEAIDELEELRKQLTTPSSPLGGGGLTSNIGDYQLEEGCEAPPGLFDEPIEVTAEEAEAGLAELREQLFGPTIPLGSAGDANMMLQTGASGESNQAINPNLGNH